MCECEGNRVTSQRSVQPVRNHLNRGLCTANTYEHHHCVCHETWTNKLTWKLKLAIMVRGVIFPTRACGVRPITMHWVSWPITADCTCRKEGLFRKQCLRETGHRGPTKMYSIWKIICFFNIKACQHILLHQIHQIIIFKIASYDPFNILYDNHTKKYSGASWVK